MHILDRIIPFYETVQTVIKGDQERRTLKTKAEIEVYLKTEVEKKQAELRRKDQEVAAHIKREQLHAETHEKIALEKAQADIKTQYKEAEARIEREHLQTKADIAIAKKTAVEKNLSQIRTAEAKAQAEIEVYLQTETHTRLEQLKENQKQADHLRQIAFEEHRIAMFEQLKQFEVDLHRDALNFDLEQQKQLIEWQRDFNRKLEDELTLVASERLPALLEQTLRFQEHPVLFEQCSARAFQTVDQLTASILEDMSTFRARIDAFSKRPDQLTEALKDINRRIHFGGPDAPQRLETDQD